ncbi:MAG: ImmA/IrrE family metallo-endopeptidase [Clostridiales bacterium]|nr:ImmA/IrrE family metallo-endopeptidase [Clostridiales bacterium]
MAAELPNVHVCKWTELRKNCHDDPLLINRKGADAKTQHLRGQSDYLIVYDDRIEFESYQRVRWTLAHEIGHIILGHLVSFEATALCSGSLTEKEYKVLEREADTFAVNLLAPMTIIKRLPAIKTKADFMSLCNLSGEA